MSGELAAARRGRDARLRRQRRRRSDLSVDIPDRRLHRDRRPERLRQVDAAARARADAQAAGGQVLLDGAEIPSLPTKEVARRLGLLPQISIAPDGITVADLVARGRYPHQSLLRQWSRDDERAVAGGDGATRVDDLADRLVDELSGGQRQRVWMAMALAQETPLLLLDEPTTFLDIAHQIEVLDLCAELHDAGPDARRRPARPQPRVPLRDAPDRDARRARSSPRASRARSSTASWSRRSSACPAP